MPPERMQLPTRISTALLSTVALASSVAEENRTYEPVYRAWAEAGGAFMESTEIRGFPGTTGDSEVRFDPGFRLGAGASYSLAPYFSLDWEVGVVAASVDRASGVDEIDAVVTQVPLLMTAMFQYVNSTGFTPFAGVGAGGSSTTINVDEARSGSAALEGSDYDFVFAWQATGGVKYAWRSGLTLGIAYKYLWTSDAEFELENDFAVGGGNDELEMDGIRSHSVLAFVSYRF